MRSGMGWFIVILGILFCWFYDAAFGESDSVLIDENIPWYVEDYEYNVGWESLANINLYNKGLMKKKELKDRLKKSYADLDKRGEKTVKVRLFDYLKSLKYGDDTKKAESEIRYVLDHRGRRWVKKSDIYNYDINENVYE